MAFLSQTPPAGGIFQRQRLWSEGGDSCLETQKIPLDKWEERCIMQTNKGADGDSIERGESQSESSR